MGSDRAALVAAIRAALGRCRIIDQSVRPWLLITARLARTMPCIPSCDGPYSRPRSAVWIRLEIGIGWKTLLHMERSSHGDTSDECRLARANGRGTPRTRLADL